MKNNRTLLIIVGVILVCCCLVGIGAVVFGGPTLSNYFKSIQNGLPVSPGSTSSPSTSVPGSGASTSAPASGPADGGLGDPLLKSDVWNAILKFESGQSCSDVTSTSIDVASQPDSKGVWNENWTVNACGQTIIYKVKFKTDPAGGTSYSISH